jgi:hypothetical protein
VGSTLSERDRLEDDVKQASDALKRFPKLSNGLTPDNVKYSNDYQTAKQRYNAAFAALRNFNARKKKRS